MSVSVYTSHTELNLDWWDSQFGERSWYSTSGWLPHAEATSKSQPLYFCTDGRYTGESSLVGYVLGKDTPFVFSTPVHPVDTFHTHHYGVPSDWASELAPSLSLGGRNPAYGSVGYRNLGAAEARRALRALLCEAEDQAWSRDLNSVSLPAMPANDSVISSVCAELGYISIPAPPAWSLNLRGIVHLHDYLLRFPQRRRVKLARDMSKLDEGGVTYKTTELSAELVPELASMEYQLYTRHNNSDVSPEDLAAVIESYHDYVPSAEVSLAYVGDVLAGFVVSFRRENEVYIRQAGFDYGVIGNLPVYFGLAYYYQVDRLASKSVDLIHFSTGADTEKRRRGCIPISQRALIKAFDSDVRAKLCELASIAG